mmetsp:Transcript_304/g.957  ORF Transcript_304/g.957 Transcript_304/m.957 type:complete len:725 (-) Transcript_304:1686-3860(-)
MMTTTLMTSLSLIATAFADKNLLASSSTTNTGRPKKILTFMISPGRTSTRSMCLLFNKYLHQRCAHNLFGEARVEDVESFVEGITQNYHPTTTTTTRKKARFESALDEAIERKGLTFFTDVPFFMPGMPCRLLVEYPEARFLYVHRDRMEHFDSVLRMHCKWDAPIHCLNANNKALRELSWGSYFQTFCDEHSKICGENPDDKVIKKNNLTSLMSSIWSAHLDEYEQSVRECIPTSKLLNISLGWYNETSETKRFQSFFGLPEENNDSLALRFSRLHINDDLMMPGRRQRMFNNNNNNNESTSRGKWRPLIMLTGPEQSSTLVSGAIRKALNETFEVGIKKICPKELINPACQTSNHRAELYAKCIPSLYRQKAVQMWNTCSSSDLENVFHEANLGRWKFTKDTHLNGWHLKTLHERGHPLFVVFRKPEHTFPASRRRGGGGQNYFAFWRSLISTTPENVRMLPAGADLLRLRNYAKYVFDAIVKQRDHHIFAGTTGIRGIQECLGHFFHFWHLITVAKSLNVPVFSVESLLLSNSRDEALIALKASGACTSSSIGSAETCEAFVDNLREMQSVPTLMHVNVTEIFKDASSFSSVSLMLDREKKYYERTKCAPVLSTVTSWCRDNVRNCATVSDVYSGATVGTTLDYLSPLKQGGVTNIDEIFNRTFSPRGLLLPGGEEKRTTEAKRLQDSVVYLAALVGSFFALAGVARFFRSRKSLEVVQVI